MSTPPKWCDQICLTCSNSPIPSIDRTRWISSPSSARPSQHRDRRRHRVVAHRILAQSNRQERPTNARRNTGKKDSMPPIPPMMLAATFARLPRAGHHLASSFPVLRFRHRSSKSHHRRHQHHVSARVREGRYVYLHTTIRERMNDGVLLWWWCWWCSRDPFFYFFFFFESPSFPPLLSIFFQCVPLSFCVSSFFFFFHFRYKKRTHTFFSNIEPRGRRRRETTNNMEDASRARSVIESHLTLTTASLFLFFVFFSRGFLVLAV